MKMLIKMLKVKPSHNNIGCRSTILIDTPLSQFTSSKSQFHERRAEYRETKQKAEHHIQYSTSRIWNLSFIKQIFLQDQNSHESRSITVFEFSCQDSDLILSFQFRGTCCKFLVPVQKDMTKINTVGQVIQQYLKLARKTSTAMERGTLTMR